MRVIPFIFDTIRTGFEFAYLYVCVMAGVERPPARSREPKDIASRALLLICSRQPSSTLNSARATSLPSLPGRVQLAAAVARDCCGGNVTGLHVDVMVPANRLKISPRRRPRTLRSTETYVAK